jgi:dienelactone hydrolase
MMPVSVRVGPLAAFGTFSRGKPDVVNKACGGETSTEGRWVSPQHNATRIISIPGNGLIGGDLAILISAEQQFLLDVQSKADLAIVWTAGVFVLQIGRAAWRATSMNVTIRLESLAAALLAALVAGAISVGQVRAEEIRLDALKIPAVISGSNGPVTYQLEAIVLRPDDRLPHPLAVLNHGSPRSADDRPAMSPYGMWAQAVAFARRGWVAVAFMRRGYGRSEGGWVENYGPCANPDYATAGRTAASDIAAVAQFMVTQPYVTKGKWISVGVSAGAFATVALTADAPPDLAAAISFAPGRGSSGPDTVCGEKQLVSAFAQYGKTSRTPLLWVSAENDHFFGPVLTARLTAAFSNAGGNVTFVKTPPFGSDGHQLFEVASGIPVWSPIVDRFLASNHLVLRERLIDVPLPDVRPPSSLNGEGREAFATYLASGPNKAFAIGSGSHFGWATGRRTVEGAIKEALGFCVAAAKCKIINVNNKPAE